MSTKNIENTCPFCGYFSDCVSHLQQDALPKEGDVSFCIKCGEVSLFDKELKLGKINMDELPFETKEEIARIKSVWRVVKAE